MTVSIRIKTLFLIFLTVVLIWFIYTERAIIAPFAMAGVFAYLFNPVVNFLSHRIKLPRTLSVIIIYLLIVGVVLAISLVLTRRAFEESLDFRLYLNNVVEVARMQAKTLPDFLRPTIYDGLSQLKQSKLFQPASLFVFFPQAISRIVSFFIFLFSAFYFLKEGGNIFDRIVKTTPKRYRIEVEILIRRINAVLGEYLRGQLLLVLIVSSMLFVALSILGVRFTLILAIFSGIAEIVPLIGPLVAGTIAALVVLFTGISHFQLSQLTSVVLVILIYFIVRQIQDYLITPHVMGKITKLHPLIILFAVLAGQHILGIWGMLFAVPIAAVIRILIQFCIDLFNTEQLEKV